MSKGLEDLISVQGDPSGLTDEQRLIIAQHEVISSSNKVIELLKNAYDVAVASGTESEDRRKKALQLAEEVEGQRQRVAEAYRAARKKMTAGADSQHRRAELLKATLWLYYQKERPRFLSDTDARRVAHERVIADCKDDPNKREFLKDGRIWSSDEHMARIIREFKKAED